jgi:hypothetical protein
VLQGGQGVGANGCNDDTEVGRGGMAGEFGDEHRTTGVRSIVVTCHYRQLDWTRKKQIAAVAVLTRYFPLHRTPPTSGYSH